MVEGFSDKLILYKLEIIIMQCMTLFYYVYFIHTVRTLRVVSLFCYCLCQVQSTNTSMSRAKLQSHKKKLWNSLELSNTFIIDNVTMDDAGKYTCIASSGGMTKTSSVTVIVYGTSINIMQ